MANRGATILLLFVIALKTTYTLQNLVEGKAKPAQYIILPPGRYDENPYDIVHNTSNCITSVETILMGNREEDLTVVTCPYGELLLNGVTRANLEDGVSDSDIRTFYTWEDMSLPMGINEAFVTLQFPNSTITPTRVALYFLEMRELRATEPQRVRLYSSTTASIFPEDDIRANDIQVTIESGTTNQNDDYEYIRYDLTIAEEDQVPLNYLRMELNFDPMTDWVFISEVEVYHLVEPLPNTTSVQASTSSSTAPSSTDSPSITISTTTTTSSTTEIKTSVPSAMETTSVVSIIPIPSTVDTFLTLSSPTSTFQTPVFVFPTINPFVLHLKTVQLNVTVNCTVNWEGDSSQLTTVWFYNGTMISGSQKYLVSKDQLHIRQITPQDGGTYECTVKHPSGWNESREFYISIEDGNLVQESNTENKSSKDLPLPIIIGAAAGSLLLLLLLCLVVTIIIVCHRKNKKQGCTRKKSYLVAEERGTFLQTYVNENSLQQRKGSVDSRYDNVHITDSLTTDTYIKGPPSVPQFPKKFKYSKKVPPPESSKLQGDYGFLGNYKRLKIIPSLLMQDQISETHFDIYDDALLTAPKSIPQSPQDIYCKAFDCNHHEKDDNNDEIYNLSMCVSIYDNPRPLAETEAPKFVEWSNIKVVAKIGEGQFGDVYLAETSDNIEVKQGNTESKYLAAIKTLKGDYTVYIKEQFEKEIKFMSRLDNANVIRLLGICNKGTPFIMMEYMANGDLHMFLKKHYLPENGKDTSEAVIPIDSIILQYVAVQIANGMRYLASHGFIHRDLAARNCLVGEDYIVKIADFGMTQDLYNESYFVMQGKAIVPIRWMAPECFFGKFSAKTDVWSYGVTLWEIFTLCRRQPYHEMSDEQLIIDVQKGCNRTLLKRPPGTPNEVYYVMADCWLYNSKKRPDFESVYNQLLNFYLQSNQQ